MSFISQRKGNNSKILTTLLPQNGLTRSPCKSATHLDPLLLVVVVVSISNATICYEVYVDMRFWCTHWMQRWEKSTWPSEKGRRHICQHELGTGCVEGGVEACVLFSQALEHGEEGVVFLVSKLVLHWPWQCFPGKSSVVSVRRNRGRKRTSVAPATRTHAGYSGDANGMASTCCSSISQYLTKTLPRWHVDGFLLDDATTSVAVVVSIPGSIYVLLFIVHICFKLLQARCTNKDNKGSRGW